MSTAGSNPWRDGDGPRGADYDRRFDSLAAAGHHIHGEADFVTHLLGELASTRILDAGCGTGRVGIELDRRGATVVGIDIDPAMLTTAVGKAPGLAWINEDLGATTFSSVRSTYSALTEPFDLVLMAGNVMLFVAPGTEGQVLSNVVEMAATRVLVVAGFSLRPGGLDLGTYDNLASQAGLELVDRYATWERDPWRDGGDYAVSVHRLSGARPARTDRNADT
jgi:SAM-dependent methyltransferase